MPEFPDTERQPLLRHPVLVGTILVLIVGLVLALAPIRWFLLFCFFAVLLAVVISFPVNLFARWMPRGAAVLLVLALVLGAIVGVLRLAVPVIVDETSQLLQQLPIAAQKAEQWLRKERQEALPQVPLPQKMTEPAQQRVGEVATKVLSSAVPFALNVASGLTLAVLLLALAFFFVHEPDSYRRGVLSLVPRGSESIVEEAWRRIGGTLHAWIRGIAVSMTIMGLLTAGGLWIAGVKGWFLLGILTFFGTFVPYAGAIASAIPGLAVALADSPKRFIYALIVYACVHVVEGYIVQPLVMRRAVELRPATLLVWQIVMSGVFGPLGFIVATPLLACVKTGVDYLYIERKLGKPA